MPAGTNRWDGTSRGSRLAVGAERRYSYRMSQPLHVVTTEAMALDPADRLRLASELIDSVDGPADAEWDEAWLTEIQARRQRGTVDAIPWSEARARVLRRLSAS